MFDREQLLDVSCPVSTAPGNAIEVPLGFRPGVLVGFEIIIPYGHAFLTGIALGFGHGGLYPFDVGTFYEGDDDVIKRFVKDPNPGVAWSAFVYNQDTVNVHAWQIRFMLNELAVAPPAPTPPLTAADIANAAAQSLVGP